MPTTIIKDAPTLTWDDALDRYETHLRARRIGKRTLRDYLREVRIFREHVDAEPAEVTVKDLRAYQCGLLTGETSRTGKTLGAGTVAKVATTLAVFFEWLTDERLVASDPASRLERPKVPRYAPGEVLTQREVEKLLAAPSKFTPSGLRDRALIETFYSTGLRLFEVVALDLADLNREEREIVVRAGKGEKGRIVPLTRAAFEALTAYLERGRPSLVRSHPDSTCAFFLSRLGRRLCDVSVADVLRKARREAGIKRAVKPHMLRRTFATSLLKNGVSVRHIQVLLGHEDLSTTAAYLKIDTKELRRELLLKHPRERIDP